MVVAFFDDRLPIESLRNRGVEMVLAIVRDTQLSTLPIQVHAVAPPCAEATTVWGKAIFPHEFPYTDMSRR